MTTGSTPSARRRSADVPRRAGFLGSAVAVAGLDQLSKHWALATLSDGEIDLIGSLRLKLIFNDGAAFSLGGGRTTLVSLMALAVAAVVAWMGLSAETRAKAIGFGVIFGAAAGNLIDRAVRAGDGVLGGHVVDFVDLQWWPVFNVADAALWVGIAILVGASWRPKESSG
ncbi:MAG: signal peptidase II [Acidimicrobiales bacterium]